jgi:phosphate transport system substrate-binding protein
MRGDFDCGRATRQVSAALAATLMTVMAAGPSHAQSVTLRSLDGSATVTGPLVRFDGNTWTIKAGQHDLSLPAATFSCISGACPAPNAFGVHGSNTIGAELMPRLIEAYAQSLGDRVRISNGADPDVSEIKVAGNDGRNRATIDLQAHGSGTATAGLLSGKALIGMASRPLNEAELAQLAQHGFGDMRAPGSEHVLGLDGIVVIVSPANPVARLSLQQLQGVFSGAVSDWSQVGGTPGKINIYARDAKSGTFDTFKTLVLDPGKRQLAAGARRFEASNELSDLVANDANGIGFIGFAYLRNAKAVSLVNECDMTFAPDTFSVKTEEYPLSRRLFLYSVKLPEQSFAAGLLDFSVSAAAQSVVRDSGFVDQQLEWRAERQTARNADAQSARKLKAGAGAPFVTLVRDVQETSRISTTLRFRSSSTELDNKALKDVGVLAEFLEFLRHAKSQANSQARSDGKPDTGTERRVVLAGFSDSAGTVEKNITLSLERANAVKQALLRKLGDPQYAKLIDTRGFGPALPVACNESEAGRDKNRRVEVWLK